MKVVDETLNIWEIEEKIGDGIIEELIVMAHNEVWLLRYYRMTKSYELDSEAFDSEEMRNLTENLHTGNPFFDP